MELNKKLEVFILTYNRLNYLKLALESLFNQTVNNIKITVVDNASNDRTKEYIELYDNAEGDGKISIDELVAMEEKELGRALTAKEKNIVNIFTQGAVGVLYQPPDFAKEAGTMVTYSDLFTFVIMLCAVITLVLACCKRKK